MSGPGLMWRGLLSAIMLALGATMPSAGAQVPPEGCSLPGYDDRCEAWSSVYDEGGPSGTQTWYLTPHLQANDTLVFATGQYVHPGTGIDPFVTIAHSQSTGNRVWVVRREIAPDAEAYAEDTALTPGGEVLVVAGSERVGPSSNRSVYGLIIAYEAATGKQLWEARVEDGQGAGESFEAVGVSPDGSTVYAAGRVSPGGVYDPRPILVALDAETGEERWRVADHGPAEISGSVVDLAVSPDGARVYATGVDATSDDGDVVTTAYDADRSPGEVLWTQRYAGPDGSFDRPVALELDPDGGLLYVAGNQGWDFVTLAYRTATGERAWLATYDGPGGGMDSAAAMAVSPSGDRVYVVGAATTQKAEAAGTVASVQLDMASVAYDAATGDTDWVSLSDLPGDLFEWGRDVAVSPDGRRVYVTGSASRRSLSMGANDTLFDTPIDVVTTAHDAATGERQWIGRFNSQTGGLAPERGGAVVLGPDGRQVFVAGYLNRVVWDPTGERRTAWIGTLSYEA